MAAAGSITQIGFKEHVQCSRQWEPGAMCIPRILYSIHRTPLQGGDSYHVHFREATGLAKATQLATGGAGNLARPWHVISVTLPFYPKLEWSDICKWTHLQKKVISFTSGSKTCLITLKQLCFGNWSISPSATRHKELYRSLFCKTTCTVSTWLSRFKNEYK